MKNLSLLVIIILFSAISCKKENSNNQSEYNKSYNAWLSYKSTVNNSYTYTVISGSIFGAGSSTKIGVHNGKIINRDYIAVRRINNGPIDTTMSWHEENVSLNTHTEGAELLTLDDVYQKANTVWLKADTKKNTIYFEAKNNGIISSCGFVPNGCQDDCFNGITIAAVTAL